MSSFADYGVVTTRELDEGAFTLGERYRRLDTRRFFIEGK